MTLTFTSSDLRIHCSTTPLERRRVRKLLPVPEGCPIIPSLASETEDGGLLDPGAFPANKDAERVISSVAAASGEFSSGTLWDGPLSSKE